jgi:hypothetical protein
MAAASDRRREVPGWRRWLAQARSDAARRLTANTWPILQAAIAATAAWLIARHLVDHRQPFFAPIAAVVSLNAARGERGSNAVRLVLGVIVGILVGELAIAINGRGYGSLGVATLVAMIAALAISGERLVIAQGAAGAILTVATSSGSGGLGRLVDALIGAGAALVLSQLVFPAEPIALLRRAEAAAATELAEGLRLVATALAREDRTLAARAVERLREMPPRLVDLARARKGSTRSVRWAPVWRRRQGPVVREEENAGQLDLLAASCLVLGRAVERLDGPDTGELAAAIGELADSLGTMGDALGDARARQETADRALDVARRAETRESGAEPGLAFAWMSLRTAATDVVVFAGVDAAQAERAIAERSPDERLRVPRPAATLRTPFRRRSR